MTAQDHSQPTPEMVAFYERRTREHIERVRRCMRAIAEATSFGNELRERSMVHDASKFSDADRTIGQRLQLPGDRTEFVYRMIDLLDSRLASQGDGSPREA